MKQNITSLNIGRTRIFIGVISGITYSILMYSFLYLSRESLRYFSATIDYDLWVLSSKEVFFYNTVYAGVSIIFGGSMGFSSILDKPFNFRRASTIRTSILNDQKVMNWVFLAWVLQLSTAFALFFSATKGYYSFSLYPNYSFLFILIIIVLYLQVWINFRRYFIFNPMKIFVHYPLLIFVLSILLGSVNLIDHEKINKNITSQNVYQKYQIEKPEAHFWTAKSTQSKVRQLFFAKNNLDSDLPHLIYNRNMIQLSALNSITEKWKYKTFEPLDRIDLVEVAIDKTLAMKYVNQLKQEMAKSGIINIGYSILPSAYSGHFRKYDGYMIEAELIAKEEEKKPDLLLENDSMQNIVIEQLQNEVLLDGTAIPMNDLKGELYNLMKNRHGLKLTMSYNEEQLSYGEFINLYSIIRKTINQLREDYSKEKYEVNLQYNESTVIQEIEQRYPATIYEEYLGRS